jgi:energy-coupling factor transporter ATP-binding protein EcfA2
MARDEMNWQRTLIMGNSGSGKSTLAKHMASGRACPHVDLDTIYWQDSIALKKRVEPAAKLMATDAALSPAWVIEGVFGWLLEVASPRATALIWLDLPWVDCKAGLEQRGPSASPSPQEYQALLAWAANYGQRQTSSSEAGHRRLFDAFNGHKVALRSRSEVASFVADLDRQTLTVSSSRTKLPPLK